MLKKLIAAVKALPLKPLLPIAKAIVKPKLSANVEKVIRDSDFAEFFNLTPEEETKQISIVKAVISRL
jgi:hypothetical protein